MHGYILPSIGHQLLTHSDNRCGEYIGGCPSADQLPLWLFAWSSIWRPREEIGRASNQAPDSFAHALGPAGCRLRSLSAADVTVTLSQDLWHGRASFLRARVAVTFWPLCLEPLTTSQVGRGTLRRCVGQCSTLGQWRKRLKPDRLKVLLAQPFLYPTHLILLGVWLGFSWSFHWGSGCWWSH